MTRTSKLLIIIVLLILPVGALAKGFTETLPKGVFLLEAFYAQSYLNSAYDNEGRRVQLIDEIERYEPGGGKQGVLIPEAEAHIGVLVSQLQVGILDYLTVGIGVPVVLFSRVEPNLRWEEGDYQWNLGRPYSEEDFWAWAETMGQSKPVNWEGNNGVLSDIILAFRYRFSDHFSTFKQNGLGMAAMVYGALPTGHPADPEEIVAAGTTSWEFHTQGDLGLHLGLDKFFKKSLDDRLTLGLEVFYEVMLPRKLKTPKGTKNPLMLTYEPYVGKYYYLDPGDFLGTSFQVDVTAYRGPEWATWLVGKDKSRAKDLPPILSFSMRYTFTYLYQSNWESKSDSWDWDREKLWRPGYKNILLGKVNINLLRLGVPAMPYVAYRNQTWIPGKNSRPADVFIVGLQIPLKFGGGM